MRLLDAVESVASYVQFGKKELSASQLAERLGFSAKRQRTPVGDLSVVSADACNLPAC